MSDVLAALGDLAHRLDADLEMGVRELAKHRFRGLLGLDPAAPERQVRDQKQSSDRHFAGESPDEQGGRLHVDRQSALLVELGLESLVKLPKAIIRSMNDSGAVIQAFFNNYLGNE